MNKSRLLGAVYACAFSLIASSANAVTWGSGTTLSIDSGSVFGFDLDNNGTIFNLINCNPFTCSPDFSDPTSEAVPITSVQGIRIGEVQSASGAHSGAPDGSETPGIDNAWQYFGITGMHLTTAPITELYDGEYYKDLDMSGWGMIWDNDVFISLAPNSLATVGCYNDCGDGDTYWLNFQSTFPALPPGSTAPNFEGATYEVFLTGTVSTVPNPAAVWLFGSGLLGLAGIARRKQVT